MFGQLTGLKSGGSTTHKEPVIIYTRFQLLSQVMKVKVSILFVHFCASCSKTIWDNNLFVSQRHHSKDLIDYIVLVWLSFPYLFSHISCLYLVFKCDSFVVKIPLQLIKFVLLWQTERIQNFRHAIFTMSKQSFSLWTYATNILKVISRSVRNLELWNVFRRTIYNLYKLE